MVNTMLLEQVERLSPSELVELRDVIQAKLDGDVPAGQWAILEQRVAEADANPDDYITLDEWKARRRKRRSASSARGRRTRRAGALSLATS